MYEHLEKDNEEKSEEFRPYINSIENNLDNNNNNINSKSVSINNISNIDDNNYIEMQLYLGKNLLFLFNIKKRIIIICSFAGRNENNFIYYNLRLHFFIKFNQLNLNKVNREIQEFKKYASLKEYICKNYSGDKNMGKSINRTLFFNHDINNLGNIILENSFF